MYVHMHLLCLLANGEIWVFNRNYTQYIPLSLYDLQAWMGSPSIFVYDCSNAGIIVQAFEQFAEQHEREYLEQLHQQQSAPAANASGDGPGRSAQQQQQQQPAGGAGDAVPVSLSAAPAADSSPMAPQPPPVSAKSCIQLAACSVGELLPMNPELPADLFTSCLTTPIKMGLRWFVLQKHAMLATDVTLEMLDKIPGN